MQNRRSELRSRAAERMPHRYCASVHVQLVLVDAQLLHNRKRLSGERFIELDQIDVIKL